MNYEGGLKTIGHSSDEFSYDNEKPQHKVHLNDFCLQSDLVTNGDYLEFIEEGGYTEPLLWLSDGWKGVEHNRWNAPLYWEKADREWWTMTLSGMKQIDLSEPVTHLSYYEAEAFARWKKCRLPTEAEWEVAAGTNTIEGNFLESGFFHPTSITPLHSKLYGDVWEWTASAYLPYPGFQPLNGALGEYNGKFMCNQMVLRGGSCVTPQSHIRTTYRNFFYPDSRWQFTGLRLAR